MTKVIIGLCEGDHDVAFLTKLLTFNGFNRSEKIIGLPERLKAIFTRKFQQLIDTTSDSNLVDPFDHTLPQRILKKDSTIVLLHNYKGVSDLSKLKDIVKQYNDANNSNSNAFNEGINPPFSIEFVLTTDADNIGVERQTVNLKQQLDIDLKHNKTISDRDGVEWKLYVFHDPETNKGELEDILLDLMKLGNEATFADCKEFLTNHPKSNCNKKMFYFCQASNTEKYRKGNRFKNKKSLIGLAGNLQLSGFSNDAIIRTSDLIKKKDMDQHQQCQEIIKLFD